MNARTILTIETGCDIARSVVVLCYHLRGDRHRVDTHMSDDKIILTPEEAISLLPEGESVHNYVNPRAGMFIGCDYDRADAERHIRQAVQREIGGPGCKGIKHALVVWDTTTHCSFFETDMAKVEAMERDKEDPCPKS